MAVELNGAEQGLDLQNSQTDRAVIESPADEADAFWDRFTLAFEESATENFADRLHPLGSLSWSVRMQEGEAGFFQEQSSRSARKALSRSFTQSLREAGVELPLMTWLKERQGHLAEFLRNSVGNVAEESVAPNELSYHVVERSWWARLSESSGLSYGIRPFRTAPYAYAGVGFKDGDSLLLLANLRYVLRNFAEHKFELALSVPLTHGLSVDLGLGYKFDRHDAEGHLAFKLFKKLDNGGILYLGMELRHQPAVYAGLAFAL
jgi:hypothetical protein